MTDDSPPANQILGPYVRHAGSLSVQLPISKIKTKERKQNISSTPTFENSQMFGENFCPVCGWFTKSTTKARSQVNRHIKEMAIKEDPDGHPRPGTEAYATLMTERGCRKASRDEEVQKLKRADRNRRYRTTHPPKKDESQQESQRPSKNPSARKSSARKTKPPTAEERIDKAFATLR